MDHDQKWDCEAIQGKGLGPFLLGMSLNHAINLLKQEYETSQRVDIIYNPANANGTNIMVDNRAGGFNLRFAADTQLLTVIEVYDPARLVLHISGQVVSDLPEVQPTFERLYCALSVCPGEYDKDRHKFVLQYYGMALFFNVPEALQETYGSKDVDLAATYRHLDNSIPMLDNLVIHLGDKWRFPEAPPKADEVYRVWPGLGLDVGSTTIKFGASIQDVLLALGPPDDVYYKSDVPDGQSHTDVFYNYYRHGLDVMFDGRFKTVIKLLLYTNVPGHYEFSRYQRCPFQLHLQARASENGAALASAATGQAHQTNSNGTRHAQALRVDDDHDHGHDNTPAKAPSSNKTTKSGKGQKSSKNGKGKGKGSKAKKGNKANKSSKSGGTQNDKHRLAEAASSGWGDFDSDDDELEQHSGSGENDGEGTGESDSDSTPAPMAASVVHQQPTAMDTTSRLQPVDLRSTHEDVSVAESGEEVASLIKVFPTTNWQNLPKSLHSTFGKAVILNRPALPNATNPFHPCFLYGTDTVLIEVTITTEACPLCVCVGG
ncbi:uncharacterized protein MONBRDRAFT_34567 [Monosiga brevicollis MX1]|uniref:Uncharacterized protein n=1 Tax=Monosiga brevicollis TaxID=81824 RepID=A9VCD8_MONBE|nr:uncharacterized protein MONBRDRAFT_34567 [Monosiga brevicollis MX1]EDQ84804.1 predicted protein [Monosiga brevicollis MX1]|eukprot:XP_001750454.1 hypothetical protein [Monosiga brevicollis MX1]